ncbi:MAG: TPM domain-containing protein [Pseudomonadota bacterium]
MTLPRKLAALTAAALAAAIAGSLATRLAQEPEPPAWVEDRSALLAGTQRERIAEYHRALLDEHDIDYRVLTRRGGSDLNRIAYAYFEAAGVGSGSATGRGLLLVIDTAADEVRLEVSASLEGIFTDAFVAYVQNRQMVPFFRDDRIADGVLATTELIVARAREAAAGKAFAPPMAARSMGGGATARIGRDDEPAQTDTAAAPRPEAEGRTPTQVVTAYLGAMAAGDDRADLAIYTADTVAMLRDWTLTRAQMKHFVRTYRRCGGSRVWTRRNLAVVRYPVEQRRCAPFFLRREDRAWKLDLTMMSTSIRFNHDNHWRFEAPRAHPYAFAFADWRFDRNGFPFPAE